MEVSSEFIFLLTLGRSFRFTGDGFPSLDADATSGGQARRVSIARSPSALDRSLDRNVPDRDGKSPTGEAMWW